MFDSVIGYYHEDRSATMKIYEDIERLTDELRGWANEPNYTGEGDCESEYYMQEGRIDAWTDMISILENVLRGEY